MIIMIFYGSVRTQRMGIRVARYIVSCIEARGHEAVLVDPLDHALPLLDRRLSDYDEEAAPEELVSLARRIEAADAFIIISAEYNGAMPPALTNLMDHFHAEYARRPAGIITYSAGPWGGMRVLPQVRHFATMLGMLVTPAHLPVPGVGKQFDESGVPEDAQSWSSRSDKFLEEIEWAARALAAARAGD